MQLPQQPQSRGVFATHGLPEILVSDNGAVFTSKEFQEFLTCNSIPLASEPQRRERPWPHHFLERAAGKGRH